MVEDIVNKFNRGMKRGFISMHTLLLLEKAPSHGYKIIQDIEEHSMGIWSPAVSTIYTVLKNLKEKELIELTETKQDERGKKIYDITPKGEETLKILLKKRKKLSEAIKSMVVFTFNLDEDFIDLDIENFLPVEEIVLRGREMSREEQLEHLKIQKKILKKRIKQQEIFLQNMEQKIKDLEE
ncbi:MAG: PadR family transcriptional regulator [Promethearchaeia archaeon]